MDANLTRGIADRKIDFGFFARRIPTAVAGMVGLAEKGPIHRPVLVTSWDDYKITFGGCTGEGYLAYAAKLFFTNGGGELYICRVAHHADVTASDYIAGFYDFGGVALNLVMAPGVTSVSVIGEGIAYAEARKDVIFIIDTPFGANPSDVIDFIAQFNAPYAATYYPWIVANGKCIPPCGAVAGCYARSDYTTHVWCAPAGVDRGRIFGAGSVAYNASRAERDALYRDGVNVIGADDCHGITIWGQRTLQRRLPGMDRVNVRRLMMYIDAAISAVPQFLAGDPGDPQTWQDIVCLINYFLGVVKAKGGIYDYASRCDDDTTSPAAIARGEVVARVYVKPVKAADFVDLTFGFSGFGQKK
jgi:phage tail sheath protein FI